MSHKSKIGKFTYRIEHEPDFGAFIAKVYLVKNETESSYVLEDIEKNEIEVQKTSIKLFVDSRERAEQIIKQEI